MATTSGGGAVIFNISGTGDAELQKLLNALPGKVQKKIMRQALREAAKVVAVEARALAPVGAEDGGTLRASIKVRAAKGKRGTIGAEVVTGEGFFQGKTFYGAFVELGTRRMKAKPFLRPAADAARSRAIAVVAEAIRTRIEGVAKSP